MWGRRGRCRGGGRWRRRVNDECTLNHLVLQGRYSEECSGGMDPKRVHHRHFSHAWHKVREELRSHPIDW